mmetsp:Transcript_74874/g.148354  ORF Transcript_74874/g.148354 Transcript_74874/m.148354 type:complete len:212 (-) Transcript_74874:214-849(-)
MQMLEAVADNVGLGEAFDAAKEAGEDMMGGVFKPVLENTVEDVLEWMGPKAGDIAVEKAAEKYSFVNSMEPAKEKAKDAASEGVMGFKDLIMDFCEDALEAPLATFRKVGVIMLRAVNDAASMAVWAIINSMGTCGALCIQSCANVNDIIEQVKEVVRDALKEFAVSSLEKKGAPKMITDKIEWGDPDEDIGEPKKRQTPKQEEMQEGTEG